MEMKWTVGLFGVGWLIMNVASADVAVFTQARPDGHSDAEIWVTNTGDFSEFEKIYRGNASAYRVSELYKCKAPTWVATAYEYRPTGTTPKPYTSSGGVGAACAPTKEAAKKAAYEACRRNVGSGTCCVDGAAYDDGTVNSKRHWGGLKSQELLWERCTENPNRQ
jgi:hypothetical protein